MIAMIRPGIKAAAEESDMRSVWIAGSVNMDIVAAAVRHPKIGETVAGKEVFFFPGGKGANQAVAAAKLGAPTALIGKVGDDAFGRELRQFLAAQNVGPQVSARHGGGAHRHSCHHRGGCR